MKPKTEQITSEIPKSKSRKEVKPNLINPIFISSLQPKETKMNLKKRSAEYLARFFDIPLTQAQNLQKIAQSNRATLETLATQPEYTKVNQWINEFRYHPLKTHEIRLELLNSCLNLHGVESIKINEESLGMYASDYVTYLNSGDSYNNTIIYYKGRYILSTLGDFLEKKGL